MKLSEAFAILESGKVVEFEATPTSGRRSVLYRNGKYFMIDTYNSNGEKIEVYAPAGAFNKNFSTDLDWQPVRQPVRQSAWQPVTWQEAILAWADGRTVTVLTPFGFESKEAKKSRGSSVTEYEITKGTWYLED